MPLGVGIAYWVCLASPRTSFYIPFHFGIADFPAGYRLPSQRPTAEAYERKVQTPFTANPQEAFWTFSNFRDKMDRKGPEAMERLKAEVQSLAGHSFRLENTVDHRVASLLQKGDTAIVAEELKTASEDVYQRSLEAMSRVLSGE